MINSIEMGWKHLLRPTKLLCDSCKSSYVFEFET